MEGRPLIYDILTVLHRVRWTGGKDVLCKHKTRESKCSGWQVWGKWEHGEGEYIYIIFKYVQYSRYIFSGIYIYICYISPKSFQEKKHNKFSRWQKSVIINLTQPRVFHYSWGTEICVAFDFAALPHWTEFLVLPRTSRFASFPQYLVVQIKKFTFGLDWIPKKLGTYLLYLAISHSIQGNP